MKVAFVKLSREELWEMLVKLEADEHLREKVIEIYEETKCKSRVRAECIWEFRTKKAEEGRMMLERIKGIDHLIRGRCRLFWQRMHRE